jgi:hypothetical protein
METFSKACREAAETSATVNRVGRSALGLAAACLLALGGFVSTLLAASPVPPFATSSTATAMVTTTMTTSPASSVVVFSGHGWGHGLGLSQWGALGYAKHGWTFDRILAHYYTGTTLGPAPVSTVRVLLASAKTAKIESTTPWTVTDAAGAKLALEPGLLVFKAKLALVDHPELQPPFTFVSKQPLLVGKLPYRGKLSVASDGKLVQVIDTLGLESYLKGVVPAEMPSAWPRVRPLRRHAQSGLRRRQGRERRHERRGRCDEGAGRLVQGQGRGHALLLHVGRADCIRARVDRSQRSVPGSRRRSVRLGIALPRLGPGAARRGDRREAVQARVADRRSANDDGAVRTRQVAERRIG